jgi:hypothetical protein
VRFISNSRVVIERRKRKRRFEVEKEERMPFISPIKISKEKCCFSYREISASNPKVLI